VALDGNSCDIPDPQGHAGSCLECRPYIDHFMRNIFVNYISQFTSNGDTWLNSDPEGQGTMKCNVSCVTYTQLLQLWFTMTEKQTFTGILHVRPLCNTLLLSLAFLGFSFAVNYIVQ
jgi:hypothetical protein